MTTQILPNSTLHRNFSPPHREPLGLEAYYRRHPQAAPPAVVSPTITNQQRIVELSGVSTGNPRDSHALLLQQWLTKQNAFAGFVAELHAGA